MGSYTMKQHYDNAGKGTKQPLVIPPLKNWFPGIRQLQVKDSLSFSFPTLPSGCYMQHVFSTCSYMSKNTQVQQNLIKKKKEAKFHTFYCCQILKNSHVQRLNNHFKCCTANFSPTTLSVLLISHCSWKKHPVKSRQKKGKQDVTCDFVTKRFKGLNLFVKKV